ncbi:MAG: hypothetical protein M1836_001384 [Candelina mexicana]|nr:MAG: hypothetical protein M1836_001384 [Candelina mexicana]
MSLKALYQQFLARPTSTCLTESASLSYVTTLTTINEPTSILKHILKEEKQLRKKKEEILDAIEAQAALFLEVETTFEFLTSGGAYLPGLDDNFVADQVVTLPITHVVHFDSNRKIQQIRLSWDQGSLLKLVDVIGSRARTWPIRDGKDQARLIASSVASIANAKGSAPQGPRDTGGTKDANEMINVGRGHSNSAGKKNVTRDPHASLSLFAPRDEDDDDTSYPTAIAPKASAKPAPRDYHDLFVGNDEQPKAPTGGKHSSETPVAHKGGAGKNFQPSRLFEAEASPPDTPSTPQQSPNKFYKPHPTKYNHFDFGDGSDDPQKKPDASPTRPFNIKHQSQWDFKDFTTPEQRRTKIRGQDVRHFGFSDEEGEHVESPVKQPKRVQARPDNATQIELMDDGTPAGDRHVGLARGTGQNKGMGLYQMNLCDDDELASSASRGEQQNKPLSNVTNINKHRKDFDSQFTLTDLSPLSNTNIGNEIKPVGENKQKAVKMMGSNWESYDQSPRQAQAMKENVGRKPTNTGIKTGGDGMGGKKGASRNWGIGNDSDEEATGGLSHERFQAQRKQQAPTENSFWD